MSHRYYDVTAWERSELIKKQKKQAKKPKSEAVTDEELRRYEYRNVLLVSVVYLLIVLHFTSTSTSTLDRYVMCLHGRRGGPYQKCTIHTPGCTIADNSI